LPFSLLSSKAGCVAASGKLSTGCLRKQTSAVLAAITLETDTGLACIYHPTPYRRQMTAFKGATSNPDEGSQ
jgi:hypothetical protein